MGNTFCLKYCDACYKTRFIKKDKHQIFFDLKDINSLTTNLKFAERCGFSIEFIISSRRKIFCIFVN